MYRSGISIHALREEGDAVLHRLLSRGVNISIHALREEGDNARYYKSKEYIKFLSTPSARRATRQEEICRLISQDFYPRPPRGGRRQMPVVVVVLMRISIHALREEGDRMAGCC